MIIFSISISSFLFYLNSYKQQNFRVDFHLEPADLGLQIDMKIKGIFIFKQETGRILLNDVFIFGFFNICFPVKFPKSQFSLTRMKEIVYEIDSQSSHLKKYTWFLNFNPLDFLIFYFFSSLSMPFFNRFLIMFILFFKHVS